MRSAHIVAALSGLMGMGPARARAAEAGEGRSAGHRPRRPRRAEPAVSAAHLSDPLARGARGADERRAGTPAPAPGARR